jgi:succinyl-CoA synthetase beta subunit
MKLYEFQSKELLSPFGIPIPAGRVAANAEEAERLARRLGCQRFAVKAQVHAGDRSASGGIKFAAHPGEVRSLAEQLLGRPLVTAQTGPAGQPVRWVYVEEKVETARSLYCAVTVDRAAGQLVLMASRHGGEVIEARVSRDPSAIARVPLRLASDGAAGDFAGAAQRIGLEGPAVQAAADLFAALARAAATADATLVEINPLALTQDGRLIALDAKVVIDDNALFRHPDLAALREASDGAEDDPAVLAADRHQLNYLRLDGDIGVVANGAGLALATLDIVRDAGGFPANFMDIRTTATSLDIAYAFELILSNPRVRVVLVNIHGGGMQRCDTVVDGIGIGLRRSGRSLPMVVRLAGNNAEFAYDRLRSYGIAYTDAADMWDAATRCVGLLKREEAA